MILSKFIEGAWITVITIPAIVAVMFSVHRHYERIGRELATGTPIDLSGNSRPIVVLPLQQWNKAAKDALCAALAIADDVRAVFVCTEDLPQDLENKWNQMVLEPAKAAGVKPPELVVLQSPYRFLVSPIVEYVLRVARENPTKRVIAMVPELVEDRWYNYPCIHTARLY